MAKADEGGGISSCPWSPWSQPGEDFMRVGFSGDVVADGRIEGHMEGVQMEVMLFSDVFFKFAVLGKCIFVTFTFIWFIKVSLARKLFSTLVAIAESVCRK